MTITANEIAPGFGDWYLAQQGYDAQQYDGPADPDGPNNLYEPLPGDHGTHGDFDSRAHDGSVQVWLDRNRAWVLAGLGIVGLLGVAFLTRNNQSRTEGFPATPLEVDADGRVASGGQLTAVR